MSVCCQAKRRRREARIDPRYAGQKAGSTEKRQRLLREKIELERRIAARGKK